MVLIRVDPDNWEPGRKVPGYCGGLRPAWLFLAEPVTYLDSPLIFVSPSHLKTGFAPITDLYSY